MWVAEFKLVVGSRICTAHLRQRKEYAEQGSNRVLICKEQKDGLISVLLLLSLSSHRVGVHRSSASKNKAAAEKDQIPFFFYQKYIFVYILSFVFS